jgi:hypothetical protein
MSDLVSLLKPGFTDEEQLPAKQMQKGYRALRIRMQTHERLVVTVHGRPDSVMLPYQDVKQLWELLNALLDETENRQLVALARERLEHQAEERISFDEGVERMRRAMLDPDTE